ncbi:uncharacterized protein LOC109423902 [Aedes albopictus]|uniref:Secreted protein n=1 Tax=Aedes albopictus TaxID=7160 RepID=A0ABM1YF51_AEDAL
MKALFALISAVVLLVICTTMVVAFPVAQNEGGVADISKMTVNVGDLADPNKMREAVEDILKKIKDGVSKGVEALPKVPS